MRAESEGLRVFFLPPAPPLRRLSTPAADIPDERARTCRHAEKQSQSRRNPLASVVNLSEKSVLVVIPVVSRAGVRGSPAMAAFLYSFPTQILLAGEGGGEAEDG
jgi:hypothetical protein